MFSSFSCCRTSAPENTPDYSYNSVGAFRTESVMLYSMYVSLWNMVQGLYMRTGISMNRLWNGLKKIML